MEIEYNRFDYILHDGKYESKNATNLAQKRTISIKLPFMHQNFIRQEEIDPIKYLDFDLLIIHSITT